MNDDDFFYPHEVDIEPHRAGGGMGPGFDTIERRAAEVLDEQRVVLDTDGAERVSNTQVTVALEHAVPPQSRVTVWPGTPRARRAAVIAVALNDNRDSVLDSFAVLSLE